MNIADLQQGLVVQDGRTVLQVSTIYERYVTAQVVYPVPPRTTVRSYTAEHIAARWKPVSKLNYQRYVDAYSR